MSGCLLRSLSLSLAACVALLGQNVAPGYAEYRAGDFDKAIPLLKQSVAAAPNDAALQGALLSSLVYEANVDEASDLADAGKDRFPNAVPVLLARGEYAYYMGDFETAETLFQQVFRLDPKSGRAVSDISRLRYAASYFRTARLLALQAYALDPDDGLVASRYMAYLVGERRKELLPAFQASHPWFYGHMDSFRQTTTALRDELDGRPAYDPGEKPQEVTLHLSPLTDQRRATRGFALRMKVQGNRTLTLLFDTGASGVLLSQRAVDKVGLNHLGTFESYGVGDDGTRKSFLSVADTCEIQMLQFKTCVFRALEGKRVDEDVDGLIGADFFDNYILDFNFQKYTLHLVPLPERPRNQQGYDREIGPDEKDFTPFYRFGHQLYLPTQVNGEATGLFLMDTGASIPMIDTTFARLTTKIYGNSNLRVHGVSGEVKKVFEADRATLRFAHYQQQNLGLTAIDLNNHPGHEEVRMSGILGMPILSLFRMKLDYRNGLVHFEYIMGEKHR